MQEATGPHCSPEQPFLMCIFAKNFKCKTFLNEAWDSWSANDNAHFINFFYYLCFFLFKINILRNVKNGGYDIIVFFYCKVCKKKQRKKCLLNNSKWPWIFKPDQIFGLSNKNILGFKMFYSVKSSFL